MTGDGSGLEERPQPTIARQIMLISTFVTDLRVSRGTINGNLSQWTFDVSACADGGTAFRPRFSGSHAGRCDERGLLVMKLPAGRIMPLSWKDFCDLGCADLRLTTGM